MKSSAAIERRPRLRRLPPRAGIARAAIRRRPPRSPRQGAAPVVAELAADAAVRQASDAVETRAADWRPARRAAGLGGPQPDGEPAGDDAFVLAVACAGRLYPDSGRPEEPCAFVLQRRRRRDGGEAGGGR